MLILNEKDMRRVVNWSQMIDYVEEAYRIFSRGEFWMPDRTAVVRDSDTILYMPCFTDDVFGTKILTLFPDNPSKGYPYLDGLMLVNDLDTGKTVSIMDGRYLTALRTGAVGGVGVRNLSRPDSKSAGVIGAGQQGFTQVIYAATARDLDQIYLYDAFDKDWESYISRLRTEMNDQEIRIDVCASAAELVEKSDIVITATPATSPVLPDYPELLRGKCVIAIGSYKHEMREIPDSIWQLLDQVYIELPFALEETGDLYYPLKEGLFTKDQVCYIGDLLETETGRLPVQGETTFFKSVGMGLLDLYVAKKLYELALAGKVGQTVEF